MSVAHIDRASRVTARLFRALALVLVLPASAQVAAAQWGGVQWRVARADSLLASGRVAAAESMYYATSSARPRDPTARAALGRYLAARGALRIGAVLLEEARLFGGDTAAIARSLAPIYSSLGDYRALATLPASPLSKPERDRVRWLVSHTPVLEFPDTVDSVGYRPVADGSGLGIVAVTIGDRQIDVIIDPRVPGIVLRGKSGRHGLKVFGTDSTGLIAVAPEVRLGTVVLSNVPARLETDESLVRGSAPLSSIGLDVVADLAPTFDPAGKSITLRRSGQIASTTAGTRFPLVLEPSGTEILMDGHWEPMTSHAAAMLLATRRWTLDSRRGTIVVP